MWTKMIFVIHKDEGEGQMGHKDENKGQAGGTLQAFFYSPKIQ